MCVFQALVGEKACYQSVSSYAGQIVYLGTKVLACILKPFYLCAHLLPLWSVSAVTDACGTQGIIFDYSLNVAVCSHHDPQGLEGGTSDDALGRHANAAPCISVCPDVSPSLMCPRPADRLPADAGAFSRSSVVGLVVPRGNGQSCGR